MQPRSPPPPRLTAVVTALILSSINSCVWKLPGRQGTVVTGHLFLISPFIYVSTQVGIKAAGVQSSERGKPKLWEFSLS